MARKPLIWIIAALAAVIGAWQLLRPGWAPSPPLPVPGGYSCGPELGSCPAGYDCIPECGPPVVRESDPPPGYSCFPAGQGRICPICLAAGTRIATPDGPMDVRDLRPGMPVWSLDADGTRIAVPVRQVGSTAVPASHQVVRLVLSDGRTLSVSPGHPTADGRTIGQLNTNDAYDGAVVISAERVPYAGKATYDLLPDSATGFYWADGILLGSTLH